MLKKSKTEKSAANKPVPANQPKKEEKGKKSKGKSESGCGSHKGSCG